MGNDTSTNTTGTSQGDQSSSTSAHGATSTSQGDQSSTATSTRSAEELERLNAELMRDNASYRRKAKEQADAASAAEQARLAEQGQFKELAAQHEARVRELEPVAQRYSTLAEQVRAKIKADIKDWPTEIMAFYPGDEAPVEQLNEWFNRSQPLLDKLQIQAKGQQPGNRPNPAPATQQTTKQAQYEATKAARQQERGYRI